MVGVTIDGTTQPPPAGPEPDAVSPEPGPPPGYPAVPGTPWQYAAYRAPVTRSPQDRRRRRVIFALGSVWLLVLVVTGVWYSFHGEHTVREQTTIGEAKPVVDTATGWILWAAGPQPATVLDAFVSGGRCDITPVRQGELWSRTIRLATPTGAESGLLEQVRDGLPGRYKARVRAGAATTLYADAGDFVSISGAVEAPGLVRLVVSTGCRAVGERPAPDPTTAPAGFDRAAVEAILVGLHASATDWQVHEVSCGSAGTATVRTVLATLGNAPVGALDGAVRPTGSVLVKGAKLVAAREGAVTTVTRLSGGTLSVSATTGTCAG
jgi:hypothetical protein